MKKNEEMLKVLIVFLLMQGMTYAANLEITNDYTNSNMIEYNNSESSESNINIDSTSNNVNFKNEGTLNVVYEEKKLSLDKTVFDKGYGVSIVSSPNKINIKNNGVISGKTFLTEEIVMSNLVDNGINRSPLSSGAGNGINSYGSFDKGSAVGELENEGLISGKLELNGRIVEDKDNVSINNSMVVYNVGNGFASYAGPDIDSANNIDNIKNEGLLLGEAVLKGGTSTSTIITNDGSLNIDNLTNTYNTNIFGSGNGVSFYESNVINGTIKNYGITSGKITLEGATSNVKIDNAKLDAGGFVDVGLESTSAGNGISFYGSSSIKEEIKNNGIISGEAAIKGGVASASSLPNIFVSDNTSIYSTGNGIGAYYSNGGIISRMRRISIFNGNNSSIENIENNGIISGKVELKGGNPAGNTFAIGSGNGISSYGTDSIGNIKNNGVISGYIGSNTERKGTDTIDFSGNGIAINTSLPDKSKDIINSGVVKGSKSSVASNGNIGIINNYGIMAGREIYSDGQEFISNSEPGPQHDLIALPIANATNYGMYVKLKSEENSLNNRKTGKVELDSEGDVIVESIEEGTLNGNGNSGKTILNIIPGGSSPTKNLDSFNKIASDTTYDNYIVNGLGIKSGVLTTEDNVTLNLNNSIINSYKTAIKVGNNSKLIASNTTFNGGGLINEDITIDGGNGMSSIEILGDSFVNGKIDLGNEKDLLVISTGTTLNDDINGGDETDKLIFKKSGSTDNIRIFHKIENFEEITIESGNVTLYETAKITGAEELKIKAGSQVNVRIDTREKDQAGTYIGNALYGSSLKITGDSSKYDKIESDIPEALGSNYENLAVLNIITNGLGIDSEINFGKTEFAGVNGDGKFNSNDDLWIKTESLIDTVNNVVKDSNGNTLVSLKGEKDLFSILKKTVNPPVNPPVDPQINLPVNPPVDSSVDPLINSKFSDIYVKLDDVYKGIYTSGNENFSELRNILNLKSADKNNYTSEQVQLKNLLSYLGDTYLYSPYSFSHEASLESMAFFRNIAVENNFKARDKEWLFLGGLTHKDGSHEQSYYGKNYHGFDTGVYDKNVDSKVYGAYAQGEYGLNRTLAVGVMFGGNKSDTKISPSKVEGTSMYLGGYFKKDIDNLRIISGAGVEYSEYDADRYAVNKKYDSNYSDKAFEVYLNGKYKHKIKENLYLEPYAQLTYAYIYQDEIKENDGPLSLNVKSKDFSLLEGTVGVDVRKDIITKNAKHSLITGVSYTRILDGAKEDNLKADFGGKEFELLVPHKTPNEVRIGVGYEVENVKGVIVGVKTDYSLPIDSEENNHKNNNKGEWRSGVTVGYRL